MKLSELEGERALDVLADIIEPIASIAGDKKVVGYIRSGQYIPAVKFAIKDHKKSVIEILAALDGENPKTYKPKLTVLPARLLEILNDPEFMSLFSSQGETTLKATSGSATETTEAKEQ